MVKKSHISHNQTASSRFNLEMLLGYLQSFLDAFPRLTQLDLSSNQLLSFPDDQLDGLADLHTLFLNDNHLSKLSPVALKRFTAIARLKLGGRSNIYECDCEEPTALQEWFTDQMNIRRVSSSNAVYLSS